MNLEEIQQEDRLDDYLDELVGFGSGIEHEKVKDDQTAESLTLFGKRMDIKNTETRDMIISRL